MVIGITAVNQNQINQFVEETGLTYPILQDEQTNGGFGGVVYDEYYIPNQGSPYPRDFIIDQNGTLAYANNEVDTEYMLFVIDELIGEWTVNIDEPKLTTSAFTLHPAFPNPFNPITNIKFDVPLKENQPKVRLQIFDITGRMVHTLINDKLSPGNHSIQWYAEKIASGIYFIRLTIDQVTKRQKIILLK